LLGLAGCGECTPNWSQIPCPRPLDVIALCQQSQDCVDEHGHPFDACGSTSHVLRIPIAKFADRLAGITDLRIIGGGCSADSSDDAAGIEASLDGVPGAHFFDVNDAQGGTFRRWFPFPSSPQLLEITHSSGGFSAEAIQFKNWECDSRNHEVVCAL
jgi:hypothetical protein